METPFHLFFRHFCQWCFYSSSGTVVLKHYGWWKRTFWLVETNYFSFLVKALSVYCKLIFQQILHSGEWNLIFWLVETILFQYLKYPFHWKHFFHLLEIYFKRILHYSHWQRIFCLMKTIFFHSHFFRNYYCNKREANIFKNFFISARGNRFL